MSRILQTKLFLLLSLLLPAITTAQTVPDPLPIRLPAADELILVGDYYAQPNLQAPSVLLLHELSASRSRWIVAVEPLLEAGYNALLVDLRGHGETGGESDWEAAVGDVQTWLDWLQEQPNVQTSGISVIGADLGGNLAVIGCENDPACLTAIAVSPVGIGCDSRDCNDELPGLDAAAVEYLDQMTTHAVTDSSRRSSALLMTSSFDDVSLQSIRQIGSSRSNRIELAVATGRGHGTEFLGASGRSALDKVIQWLDEHTPPNLTTDAIEALVAAGDPDNGEMLFAEGIAGLPVEEGEACIRCHNADSEDAKMGPGLLNVGQRAATRVDGQSAAVYLYHSIVAPDSYLVDGYSSSIMPWRYDKGFTEEQIADLVAYLLTL